MTKTRSLSSTDSEMLCVMKSTVCSDLGPDAQQLEAHLFARQRVERAERLIHEQHLGLVNQRAADGGALLHAAGKLPGQAVTEATEPDQLQQFAQRDRGRAPASADLT